MMMSFKLIQQIQYQRLQNHNFKFTPIQQKFLVSTRISRQFLVFSFAAVKIVSNLNCIPKIFSIPKNYYTLNFQYLPEILYINRLQSHSSNSIKSDTIPNQSKVQ